MTDPKPTPQALLDLDRVVHEPARLAILAVLSAAERVEFKFLEAATGLTKGNLSSHCSKLEAAGYVGVDKEFRGKVPVTTYWITPAGKKAFTEYRMRLYAGLPKGK